MFAVVLVIWFQCAIWILLADPEVAARSDLPLQMGLLASFGCIFFSWMTLHSFGLVGEGSGAGFRLAVVGLAARCFVAKLVEMTGAEADQSVYDAMPSITGPVWWARNVSLVAYGCGLALVVLACATDLTRRRRGHAWVTTAG